MTVGGRSGGSGAARSIWRVIVVVLVTAASARSIGANATPELPLALNLPTTAPAPQSTEEHLLSLESRLATEQRRYVAWRRNWMIAYGGLALGNLALVPLMPRGDRIDYYTGAGTSAIGAVTLALQPVQPSADVACSAETLVRVGCVEQRYDDVSAFQRRSRSWFVHAINFGFNAGVSAFLGFGFGHWRSAAANLVGGTAIGELQIATQPHGALEPLR